MPPVELTLIGKPECHLCDVAEEVVEAVLEGLGESAPEVRMTKLSITDHAELHDRYWERIPVLLVNGVEHAQWRVNPERLRTALLEA